MKKKKSSISSTHSSKRSDKSDEHVDFAEEAVAIIDEFAELEAVDPTFAGMREGPALERAHKEVMGALRDLYQRRYRTRLPADDLLLFTELRDELVLPHDEKIEKLIRIAKNERFSSDEEKEILHIIERFIKAVKKL